MRHIRFASVIGTAAITAAGLAALAGCGTTTAKGPRSGRHTRDARSGRYAG